MMSIDELYSQNKSIPSEITNLGKTKQSIENLSEQITTNVTELNNTIHKKDRFNPLVKAIKDHLEMSIRELKELDKTEDINKILEEMVKQTRSRSKEIIQLVKEKLHKHEIDVNRKIREYSGTVKEIVIDQRKQLPPLIKEIESLVGTGPNQEGKLSRMAKKIVTFRDAHKNEIDYLEIVHIHDINHIHDIGRLRPWPDDKQVIKQIESTLNEILPGLKGYQIAIERILEEMGVLKQGRTGEKMERIDHIEDVTNKFSAIEIQNNIYWDLLERSSNDFSKRAELKRQLGLHLEKFKKRFRDDVKVVTSVTYKELLRIHREIKKEVEQAEKIQKRLNNAIFLLEYLDEFDKQKKILDRINLLGNGLTGIKEIIETMEKFRDEYQIATSSIVGSSSVLFNKFEKGNYDSGFWLDARSAFLPRTMNLDEGPIVKLKNHIEKLEAIKEFNDSLTQIKNGMSSLNENSQPSKGSDVEKALEWLVKIDGTLTIVYKTINLPVTKMKTTYSKYQEQINATSSTNGENIQGHVDKINKIPNKIAELHSKVIYNIVLLKISKSASETLKKMEKNVWNKRT